MRPIPGGYGHTQHSNPLQRRERRRLHPHISEEYINGLIGNLDEYDFYSEGIFDFPHEYPFTTELSVLKVRIKAAKKLGEKERNDLRAYINVIVDSDDEHLDEIHEKDSIKLYSKRLEDALKILAKVKEHVTDKKSSS